MQKAFKFKCSIHFIAHETWMARLITMIVSRKC